MPRATVELLGCLQSAPCAGIVPAGAQQAGLHHVEARILRLQAHRLSQPDLSALVPLEIDGDIDGFLERVGIRRMRHHDAVENLDGFFAEI